MKNDKERLEKLAKKNAQIKALGVTGGFNDKKDDLQLENITFDDNGRPLSQVQIVCDKLPNLVHN